MTEIGRLELTMVVDDKKGVVPGTVHIEAKEERIRWHMIIMGHWCLSEMARTMGIVKPESRELKLGE